LHYAQWSNPYRTSDYSGIDRTGGIAATDRVMSLTSREDGMLVP
jgi:hypothetical protein